MKSAISKGNSLSVQCTRRQAQAAELLSARGQVRPNCSHSKRSAIIPENFKKPMLTKMNKLSTKGWSYHLRLLKLDEHALAYYRNVPKDYDGTFISLNLWQRRPTPARLWQPSRPRPQCLCAAS
jgi:hypothetical protein